MTVQLAVVYQLLSSGYYINDLISPGEYVDLLHHFTSLVCSLYVVDH